MKILHTADWHLGHSFYEYDRKAEHLRFMAWLRDITVKSNADILLIAGDIFDSPNPSAESQKLYYSFLRDITNENPNLRIIIIAGNHDSAARLEAPNPLLENMNVTVRGIVKRTVDGDIDYDDLIVPLNIGGYCLTVPYLRHGDFPATESYSASIKAMYDNLLEKVHDKAVPVIAMGHLQATGSEISENDRSERTIIGGLECVSPEAFSDGITYTALGHLHRGQKVSGRENVRYSGTPIPMSFAEKNNKHGIVLIGITEDEKNTATARTGKYKINIERIEYDGCVKLISIPKEPAPLSDVLNEISSLPDGDITDMSPFVEIKVLITEPEPSMRHQIENALAGKSVRQARITAIMKENEKERKTLSIDELCETNPMDIAEDIFERQYGGEKMPEAMKKLLHEVIQEVQV